MTADAVPAGASLHMLWPAGRRVEEDARGVAPGYRLRVAGPGDVPAFRALMTTVDLGHWTDEELARVRATVLPGGWQVVIHEATGDLVATGMAQYNPIDVYPQGYEVGWIAAHPEHAGHRLGRTVTAAATARLLAGGAGCVFLRTDDFRLPALRTYLGLGFEPHLIDPGMAGRWEAICDRIGWPFTPDRWPAVP